MVNKLLFGICMFFMQLWLYGEMKVMDLNGV